MPDTGEATSKLGPYIRISHTLANPMKPDATPFMILSYPSAILHVDGDAFFASVEQAVTPSLKNKPVVTGKERGIIAAASYEAKALGIQRSMSLRDARKLCPQLTILPSDYETYSLYSKRMFHIMRRYTPLVEEYSIDEAFADITGMRRVHRKSYEQIAQELQAEIHRELDITVSIGLGLSKTLAKLASSYRKPNGFTGVRGKYIHLFLARTPTRKVWGFGPNTVRLLAKYHVSTAYDFVCRPENWAKKLLGKPGVELWNELRGTQIHDVTTEEKTTYATISKARTFTPATSNRDFVYARVTRNLESAMIKARRHHLKARTLGIALRTSDFVQDGLEAKLNRATVSILEVTPLVRDLFDYLFNPTLQYRAATIVLGGLQDDSNEQYELFEDRLKIDNMAKLSTVVDEIDGKYGKHTVTLGSSLFLNDKIRNDRDHVPVRKQTLLKGETARQRLKIPRMMVTV